MIPKKGSNVYINQDFINEFNNTPGAGKDWHYVKDNIVKNYNWSFLVEEVKMGWNSFEVKLVHNPLAFVANLNPQGVMSSLGIQVPFLSDKKPNMKQLNHIYCSCDNPKIKHVYVSTNLHYDFCSICKKEAVKPPVKG